MDYLNLTGIYESINSTSKRLEKTNIIANLLKFSSKEDIPYLIPLLLGKIFPEWEEKKIGVSSQIVIKTLSKITSISKEKIEKEWSRTGDLGEVAFNIIKENKQRTLHRTKLTIKKVLENIQSLPNFTGAGTIDKKIALISELLTSAEPIEAKYIVRTVLEDLRVGIAEGTIRDAIVWAYLYPVKYDKKENEIIIENREKYNEAAEAVQHAYDTNPDFSKVIILIKEHRLKTINVAEALTKVSLIPGIPIKVMLYPKAEDLKDAFSITGTPSAIEFKYDGFRLLIHKNKDKIFLFTRRLENVTNQFPDVVEVVKKNISGDLYIIDSEVIGIDPKTRKWLPFQNISQRIKRKYNIQELVKTVPVQINAFDLLYLNNKSLIKEPFKKRRELLKKIISPVKDKLQLAVQIVTSDLKEAEKFYKESLSLGNEGVMFKNLEGIYKPGARVGYGVKVKPVLETLDLIITGAQWGEGKRASWLSSFDLSCLSKDKKQLLTIGKVGTGIKEKSEGVTFIELTKLLKPLIKKETGKTVEVEPKIIVEIGYEEIQKSTNYNSGFALRFPKVKNLRPDLSPRDCDTIDRINKIYSSQRGRKKWNYSSITE